MSIVMRLDQHRAQITAEWIDLESGENAKACSPTSPAWHAWRAKLFDRCAPKDGIVPFDALVEQFTSVEPYSNARRVFVTVDNGSAHRGKKSIDRLQGAWPNLILLHTPVHASWVN